MIKQWLIIAAGEKLSPKRLHALAEGRRILACDGAGLTCLEQNIIPEILLGDFDTIGDQSLQALQQQGCQIVEAVDQNKSDTEKAILHALDQGANDITLCQAMGDRTDHSLMNLRLLRRYHSSAAKLRVAREHELIFYLEDETLSFEGAKGKPIAILGFDAAVVSSQGLKYELDQTQLGADHIDSTSNHLVSAVASLEVKGQALIVCCANSA